MIIIYLGPTIYWDDWDDSWPFPLAAQLFVLPGSEAALTAIARKLALKPGAHRPDHLLPHYLLSDEEATALTLERRANVRLVSGDGVVHAAQIWRRHRASIHLAKPKSNRRP